LSREKQDIVKIDSALTKKFQRERARSPLSELYASSTKDTQVEIVQEKQDEIKTGSLKFSGGISFITVDSKVDETGFVCLRSPSNLITDPLDRYDGLEFRLKTDGRLYVAQIRSEHTIEEDDLYQLIIPPCPPYQWTRVILPINDFMLTWRGKVKDAQVPYPTEYGIKHLAILMAERREGPFSLNIDWIKLVHVSDDLLTADGESRRQKNIEFLQNNYRKFVDKIGGRTDYRESEGGDDSFVPDDFDSVEYLKQSGISNKEQKEKTLHKQPDFDSDEYLKQSGISDKEQKEKPLDKKPENQEK